MSTPQDTVISLPELLELILSHLPMRELLCNASLVSKTWQATTRTPSLQRILFFESDPSADPALNPLLAEIFSPFFTRLENMENTRAYHWPGRTESIMEMPWAKNPDAFRRVGASWRRMLVTQPPVRSLFLEHVTKCGLFYIDDQATLSDLSLRMGFLYDLILPLTQDGVWFWIDWHGAGAEQGHSCDSTIHLQSNRKSGGGVVILPPVKRDTGFESEEMQIVEIRFRSPLPDSSVGDDRRGGISSRWQGMA
ncbi:putative f-box domain protein [Favolaschia claudopus]|uniref:F-box domain protein n=1 Tax=Favolaschia claudopus TaxID=2862362 RepID=A0AAW0AL48_9AGAR